MAHVMAMVNDRESVAKVADTFKMVYTPFHGCGYKLVPEALRAPGREASASACRSRWCMDGNFPTVVSPNPENPEGFYLAIQLAGQGGRRLHSGHRPGQRPGGHHGPQPGRLLHPRHRQPDRRAAAGLPDRGHAPRRQAAGASRGSSRPSSPRRWPGRWPRPTASPAAIPSPASSSWRRRRTSWRVSGAGQGDLLL